jgi:hypothetical protein
MRTEPARILLPALALAVFSAACAIPEPPGNEAFPDRADAGDVAVDVAPDVHFGDAVVVSEMAGTWLHYQEVSTCVGLIEPNIEQMTRYLYVVEVEQDSRRMITEKWNACRIDISRVFGQQPFVNTAVLETSFPVFTGGHVAASTEVGAPYHSGPVPEVWGIDFEDPVLESFPASPDDPRVVDSDQDGNPGVSMDFDILTCQKFLVNRTVNNHHGSYVEPDRIEGTINSNTQQLNVGPTNACSAQYQTSDNQARNVFYRQRVDGRGGAPDLRDDDGVVSCDAALSAFDSFFSERPVDDSSCVR